MATLGLVKLSKREVASPNLSLKNTTNNDSQPNTNNLEDTVKVTANPDYARLRYELKEFAYQSLKLNESVLREQTLDYTFGIGWSDEDYANHEKNKKEYLAYMQAICSTSNNVVLSNGMLLKRYLFNLCIVYLIRGPFTEMNYTSNLSASDLKNVFRFEDLQLGKDFYFNQKTWLEKITNVTESELKIIWGYCISAIKNFPPKSAKEGNQETLESIGVITKLALIIV